MKFGKPLAAWRNVTDRLPSRIAALLFVAAANVSAQPRLALALPSTAKLTAGADVTFDEHEAEDGATNGEVIGPDRSFLTIAAEASSRRAVRMVRPDQFVAFTLRRPANAMTVRVAIPDSPDGSGMDAGIDIIADGNRVATLSATSRYAWYYGAYPFSNRPADGRGHHFFDESRVLLGRTFPAGTIVRLQVPSTQRAPWYVIDLADFELVPEPSRAPRSSLSVVRFGADPSGRTSSTAAFREGIEVARRKRVALWIPPGRFKVDEHLEVDRVTILGAGPWRSVVTGKGVGFYGKPAPRGSVKVTLRDFAIMGEVTERVDDDQTNAIGGAIGGGSLISNLWIQHHKVGLWFDGPMRGIRIRGLRVLDCAGDGLNFHRGVSDARVEQSFFRNTGDDGLASWSHIDANHHIAFRRNTVVLPILANGIAIYGGHDIEVSGNLVRDTVTEGGGLHLGNRFTAVPASGRIDFFGNTVVRGGSFDPRWRFGVGALWFYALDHPISADIRVRDTTIVDSTEESVQFLGQSVGDVAFDGLEIRGGGPAFQLQGPGSAGVVRSAVTGQRGPAVLRCDGRFRLDVHGTSDFDGFTADGCPR